MEIDKILLEGGNEAQTNHWVGRLGLLVSSCGFQVAAKRMEQQALGFVNRSHVWKKHAQQLKRVTLGMCHSQIPIIFLFCAFAN